MNTKFLVVEAKERRKISTFVDYLVHLEFKKFEVITDLIDHPSFKCKEESTSPVSLSPNFSTTAQHTPPRTAVSTPTSISTPVPPHQNKPRASIESIAKALSTKNVSSGGKIEEHCEMSIEKEKNRRKKTNTQKVIQQIEINYNSKSEELTPKYNNSLQTKTISKLFSKFVVVELSTENKTMALVEYLVKHEFDKFSVVTDLMDHPSWKNVSSSYSKSSSASLNQQPTPLESPIHLKTWRKRTSIDSILNDLSSKCKKAVPIDVLVQQITSRNEFTQKNKESLETTSMILNAPSSFSTTFQLGTFGVFETVATKAIKHPNGDDSGGLSLKKQAFFCKLCSKPQVLKPSGSRSSLTRHVISHSRFKPYKCFECNYNGRKEFVVRHARASNHRNKPQCITTEEMRADWNRLIDLCFPDYSLNKNQFQSK